MLHQLFCFKLSKTLASRQVVFGDSVVCGKRIVPAFSGVSFEVLKGKSDRRFNGEILLCGKVYLTVISDGVTPYQW